MTSEEILDEMLSNIPSNYDTSVGSFFYDLLYPAALRIFELQEKIAEVEKNAFAITATGEHLDRKVAEQGLTRRSATYASGVVRVHGDVGAIVRAGAKFAAADILFAADEAAAIETNGYVDVGVTCMTAGAVGNVGANKITRFPVTLPGLTAVTNNEALSGGYDTENDYDLLERYLDKVQKPNASGNANQYAEWAKEVSGVGSVQVSPLEDGPGTVKIFITGPNNSRAEDSTVAQVLAHIEENRPIGASVTVETATEREITIGLRVTMQEGADKYVVGKNIEDAIEAYFATIGPTGEYVSYARLGSAILAADGVEDYANMRMNSGTVNIELENGEIPVLGTVVIDDL